MDLQGKLGYAPKKPESDLCNDCHSLRSASFSTIHSVHVDSRHYDCTWCHNFTRPERGLVFRAARTQTPTKWSTPTTTAQRWLMPPRQMEIVTAV